MARHAAKVQPQPGSGSRPGPGFRSHQEKAEAQQPSSRVLPVEPEDAQLTGTSRSLQRRVLGLNVEGGQAQQHPKTPAGQHATGSFTGKPATGKQSGRKHS